MARMIAGLLIAGATLGAGCDGEKKNKEAAIEREAERVAATLDAAGPADPVAKAVGNPDWPCATDIGADHTRFRYEGPTSCHAPSDAVTVGCPTVEELDRGNDGTIDRTRTFRYDTEGNMIAVEYQKAAGGPITTRLAVTYTMDGTPTRMDIDGDGDGKVDGNNVYEKKGADLVRTLDKDGDGKPELRATTHYAADGRIEKIDIDQGADGSIDATGTFRWDGKRLVEDRTEAGTLNILTTYVYSCPG